MTTIKTNTCKTNKGLLVLYSLNLVSVLSSPLRGERRRVFILCVLCFTLNTHYSFAQNIGINPTGATANASALLDLDATGGPALGLLVSRIALTAINLAAPVTSPATSLLVYNTATANTGTLAVSPGYYYWDATKWVRLQTTASTAQDWSLLGNAGTTAGTNFLGTTDAQDVVVKTNNTEQMRVANTNNNVGIGTAAPNASAKVDITSTTQGFAMPRMTTAQRLAITSPANGLQVYDISLNDFYYFNTTSNKWDCVSIRAGTVNYFANTATPIGYLACAGQTISTTQYPELFTAIGYTYGGSGAVFNVPDLRGEFIRGADMGRGVDAARVLGSLQIDDFKSHNHQLASKIITSGTTGPVDVGGSASSGGWGITTNSGGIETRPRNVALLPCIKY